MPSMKLPLILVSIPCAFSAAFAFLAWRNSRNVDSETPRNGWFDPEREATRASERAEVLIKDVGTTRTESASRGRAGIPSTSISQWKPDAMTLDTFGDSVKPLRVDPKSTSAFMKAAALCDLAEAFGLRGQPLPDLVMQVWPDARGSQMKADTAINDLLNKAYIRGKLRARDWHERTAEKC